jgi:Ca-activated chloride channel family protein
MLLSAMILGGGCAEKKAPEPGPGAQQAEGEKGSEAKGPTEQGKKPEGAGAAAEEEKPEGARAAGESTISESAPAGEGASGGPAEGEKGSGQPSQAENVVEKIHDQAEAAQLGPTQPGTAVADSAGKVEVIEGPAKMLEAAERMERARKLVSSRTTVGTMGTIAGIPPVPTPGTEQYGGPVENEFKDVSAEPMSTFSIDVDTASYSNIRRFIQSGGLPPADAVRIEEIVNYFDYEYPDPTGEDPFAIVTEVSQCPWNEQNRLVLVGLQGKRPPAAELPPSNLVFLLDVSGSMSSADKLPLVQGGYRLMVSQLRKEDRVAIVTYAGAAGLVLPSTPGDQKQTILEAIDRLSAGGSTAGAEGILLAYEVAKENFIQKGNNRVILATDGDFNVGISSNEELEKLIEDKRKEGIFLSVLGFGTGNLKDQRMEQLADKGNGNYAYVDGLLEAKKVFMTQLTGTLFTIAKDVKIQIEFNPLKVAKYRLVGYENRMLAREDFLDDKKDAGELGAGHRVTALYEVVPAEDKPKAAEESRYTETKLKDTAATSGELMLVKLRYKHPDLDKSVGMEQPALDQDTPLDKASANFRFAAAAAGFGMLLKDSKFKGTATFDSVLALARGAKGEDPFGYRAEFIQLVEKAQLLVASGMAAPRPTPADRDYRLGVKLDPARSFVGGIVDKQAVNKYLRVRSSAYQKCFTKVVRKNPNAGGRLDLSIKIDLDGRATVKPVKDNTGDPELAKCVIGKLQEWSFPKPEGKPVEFTVVFRFRQY